MAIPTYQAAGSPVESQSGSISVPWPAHQAGDIALLIVENSDWYGTTSFGRLYFSTRAGFKEIPGSPVRGASTGGGEGPLPSTSGTQLSVFWKRAESASEAQPVIELDGDHIRAQIVTFRGCAPTGVPWNKIASASTVTNSTAVSIPGLTTTVNDCLIVDILSNSGFMSISGWTNASLGSLTERVDNNEAALTNGSGHAVATGTKATAGAVNATTATASSSGYIPGIKIALTDQASAEDKCPYLANVGDMVESASADITVPWPPHEAGDIGILIVESGGWPMTLATAAGFQEVPNSPQHSGSSGTTTASGLSVWWCRATSGAMSSPVVDFIADHVRAVMLTFRGCISAGNPWDVTAGNKIDSASASVSIPGATTTKTMTRVLAICTHSFDAVYARSVAWANSVLESIDQFIDSGSVIGGGSGFMIAQGRHPAAGDYGATTMQNLAGSILQARMSLALQPPSSDLIAESGEFAFSGSDANFYRSRALQAETGAFALTGNDVTFGLIVAYLLLADTGFFSLQGSSIGVNASLAGGWQRESEGEDGWQKEPPLN